MDGIGDASVPDPAPPATGPPAPGRRRHVRRLAFELVPVAILVAAAIPAVAGDDLTTAAGSLTSMVASCLLPALLVLHLLVRSDAGHLVGVVLLTVLVVYLLLTGDIEEPLGGLVLLQLMVWAPLLAIVAAVVDAIALGVTRARSRPRAT